MELAQFQNIPIIFRLKIRVKFQIHGKIYKRTEKIFFRVFGNTQKKKIHGKNFRVLKKFRAFKKFPCISNTRKFFPCIVRNTRKFFEYTEFFLMHGKHRPGEQTPSSFCSFCRGK